MQKIIQALQKEMNEQGLIFKGAAIPKISLEDINITLDLFKKALFPGVFYMIEQDNLETFLENIIHALNNNLLTALEKFNQKNSTEIAQKIIETLPHLKRELIKDIVAIYNGDPAAKTHEEVVLAYPSFEAIMIYRIAHELTELNLDLFARMCASIGHRKTGIDIHPKARIGHSFCIDHGTAIVIGETSVIGNNVKLYQGVTIGALSVSKKQENKKRHPTIEDNVTIYARTTILGGDTTIGENSIIGGNVWLTSSVPKNSKIYNKEFNIEHPQPNH
jgi:serine O-acetyltransferase